MVAANQTNHPELEPVGSQTNHQGRGTQRQNPLEEQQQPAGSRIQILQGQQLVLQTRREPEPRTRTVPVHQSQMPRAPELELQIHHRVPELRMLVGHRMHSPVQQKPCCPQN